MNIPKRIAELVEVDIATLEPEDLSKYMLITFTKRKQAERLVEKLESMEKQARELAGLSEFMAGVNESKLAFGSFKRAENEFMVLPEGGWPTINKYIADRILAGEDPNEVLAILSHQRIRPSAFENLNNDELPVGIGREVKKFIRFTGSKTVHV